MLKKVVLSFCLLLFLVAGYAQPGKAETKVVNGTVYYVHKVKRGHTVYGLHRMYDVPVADILDANPGAKDGLDVGEIVLIPKGDTPAGVATETQGDEEIDSSKYHIHIAKQSETLYSIARQYGIKGKELVKINGNKSLSIGDKVLIPKEAVDSQMTNDEVDPVIKNPVNELAAPGDSIILHKIVAGETLYGLSQRFGTTPEAIRKANNGLPSGLKVGEEVRIPVKVETVPGLPVATDDSSTSPRPDLILKKPVYSVAIFLPFKLDKFDAELLKCPTLGDCKPYMPTIRAVEFYQGVEMAIDSMQKAGLSLNVHVYDTQADTSIMKELLAKPEMKNVDMMFGPLAAATQKVAADFAWKNQIQLISPVNSTNKLLFKNPYVTKAVASAPTQVKAMARYVVDTFGTANVVLFDDKSANDHHYFAKVFKKEFSEMTMGMNTYRDTLAVIEKGYKLKNLYGYLNREGVNVLIVPSRNIGYVSSFLTDLNKVKNDHGMRNASFVVFGLEDWMKFEQLDYNYINNFNVHITASKYLDFQSDETLDFISKFRKKHGNDPGVHSYMGFDVMMQHLAGLLNYGSGFASRLNNIQLDHLHINFKFAPVGEGSGYENQSVYILAYENYKLVKKR